ncbi:transporter substrate-binding domain-containing protein [Kribbella sp. NBC_01245]|uniref:transporter substrate-binding domain-containing protein n=1 Tax=Kribbella sp. NBC_01245 TaxID=2903578 RepID=UPI002E2E4CEE|nr:transporter substrate-binding domain-containing protein [Kribbella sp. NBC_01245]
MSDLVSDGVLRVGINLGNPVLAQGTAEAPSGVSVDIGREIATRLGASVELVCFGAARESLAALVDGRVDVGFLALEPARENEVAFTAPYVMIEGVYAVPRASRIQGREDVDRAGVRVGVKRGSAYDLYLSRTLEHAEVVRGDEGVEIFRAEGLEVAAGIRQPLSEYVAANEDLRLIDERFMEIRQAVAIRRGRRPETLRFLAEAVEDLKSSGFIAAALERSGHSPDLVAPPA